MDQAGVLDYEYDSEAEWEEGDDEGEDVEGEDAEKADKEEDKDAEYVPPLPRARERSERKTELAAAAHQQSTPTTDASANYCLVAAALLRQERAESRAVGGRPPEPPLRPARSHMCSAALVLGRTCARPHLCSAALVLGRTCARPHLCSAAQVLGRVGHEP
jgi:hypothetical protein